jgi:hypothetical protein
MHKLLQYFRDNRVIRERDADGLLSAAGFKWREPAMWVFHIFGTAGFVLAFYWLMCLADRRTPTEFTTAVFIALLGCVGACVVLGSIRRGIAFERDGRVSNRGGWVNWLDLVGGIKDHADIASIEVTKTQEGAGVAVYTVYGGTMMLSEGLNEPAARLAAVQLTMALREMRESLATIQNFQQPRPRCGRRRRPGSTDARTDCPAACRAQ